VCVGDWLNLIALGLVFCSRSGQSSNGRINDESHFRRKKGGRSTIRDGLSSCHSVNNVLRPHGKYLGSDLRAASLGWGTYPSTPSLPLRPDASPYPRFSTHAGQPVFAGGEPLDVPEAMELLSGMKRQKEQTTRPGQGLP